MSSTSRTVLGVAPLIGMFLGVLHNFFYWGTLGVSYFSFVGFQEVFVSSVQPIVYFFLIFIVVTVFYYFVVRFFAGEEAISDFFHKPKPYFKRRLDVLIGALFLGGLAFLFGYLKGWMYFYLYLAMFVGFSSSATIVRTLRFYRIINREVGSLDIFLVGFLLIASIYVCFVGYRSAYFIKNGSEGVYFQEHKDYGRYSGAVGDYFVFYQDTSNLLFLPKSEVGSFTLVVE